MFAVVALISSKEIACTKAEWKKKKNFKSNESMKELLIIGTVDDCNICKLNNDNNSIALFKSPVCSHFTEIPM